MSDLGWTNNTNTTSIQVLQKEQVVVCLCGVSQREVLGWFYNSNTTPKDKERVVVCLCGTGQELHQRGYYTEGIDAAKEQGFLWLAEVKKDD